MTQVSKTVDVFADAHQFYLTPSASPGAWNGSVTNALLEPLAGGGFAVVTGVSMGLLRCRVEAESSSQSFAGDLGAWDDAVEAEVHAPQGSLQLCGWGGEMLDTSNFALAGAGYYKVQCAARGRDRQWDEAPETAVEEYLFRISPTDDPPSGVSPIKVSQFLKRWQLS